MNNANGTNGRQLNSRDASHRGDNWLYAMPLFIMLLAMGIDVQKPTSLFVHGSIVQESSTYRQVVYGSTYLLAFILAIRKMAWLKAVLSDHWAYVAVLIYILLSALWSAFPMQVIVTWVHFTGFFFIGVTAAMAFRKNEEFFFRTLFYVSSISIVVQLLIVVLYPMRGIEESGRWMGLTPHPNSLGVIALIAIWSSVSYLYCKNDVKTKVWAISLILLSFLCLYGSNSMTSTILAAGMVVGIPFAVPMARKPGANAAIKLMVVLFLLAIALLVAYILFPKALTIETFFHAIGRTTHLTGRAELWQTAESAIAERPLLGWSFDNMFTLSSEHMIRYSQFHNGYIDLLVRGGILGLMFAIYMLLKSILYLFKLPRSRPTLFVLLSSLFVAILIHNISEASLVISPNVLWLLLSILYFILNRNIARAPYSRHV